MVKKIIISICGLAIGIVTGFFVNQQQFLSPFHTKEQIPKEIVGFLPYWQLDKANFNEEKGITTLTYFSLNVDGSGHIVKFANDQEEDPGWYQLHSDKVASFFSNARKNNVSLSLLIASGNADAINTLMNKPVEHATTLLKEVAPLMRQYHFSDLNLDIEDTSHAPGSAQKNFTQFVKTIKAQLDKEKLGTLTLEISPNDAINDNLITIASVAPYANHIILMAYDYHSPTSFVTGPVAPLHGAGVDSEYDVTTAVQKTLQFMPPNQLILGVPLYGYEWETLNTAVRSAIIPGSGVLASNNRIESLLSTCTTCSAFFDNQAQEGFIVYQDSSSGTFHQISLPTKQSLLAKTVFAEKMHLGGVALWALGYEENTMLSPLASYK